MKHETTTPSVQVHHCLASELFTVLRPKCFSIRFLPTDTHYPSEVFSIYELRNPN